MSNEFEISFEKVIGHEGGYVDDPTDRGGETKYGISKRAYPNEDIKNLTLSRAKELYYADYWVKAKCDLMGFDLAYLHFDTAVNMGVGTAARILQKAACVMVDGAIGAKTMAAVKRLDLRDYVIAKYARYCNIVGQNHSQAKFIKGWSNRLEYVYGFISKRNQN